MNWLGKFKRSRGVLGIERQQEGLTLAARDELGTLRLLAACSASYEGAEEKPDEFSFLEDYVDRFSLQGQHCHLVLPAKQYQLLLVEAPEVPEEEMREALRWRVKDLIAQPLEDVCLDVFALPENGTRAKRMVYVVVSSKSYIQSCVDLVRQAGLNLKSIDISELALRNISLQKEEGKAGGRGLAFIKVHAGAGNVCLYQEGNLYLSRAFQVNYKGGLLDDLPLDALGLEVQRSLDYYERQMGQRPPAALYFFGENVSSDKLDENFKRALPGKVDVLELDENLEEGDNLPMDMLAPCMGAIGASLRGSVSI